MSADVVVLGDALLDVRAEPSAPVRHGSDVPASISLGPGGQGANVAVRLARRGVTVELVTALGPDPAGAILRDALGADGVVLHDVGADATGTVVVMSDPDGERTMLSQRPPFSHRVDRTMLDDAAWLVVSGYLLLEPEAGDLARAVGASAAWRVLLGCAVPDDHVGAWLAAARAVAPHVVVLSRAEADRLDLAGWTAGVVMTDAAGAEARIGDVRATVATPDGPPAVDATGAGDAFAAALIACLRAAPWPPTQSELSDALGDAVALAAAVARTAGAQGRVDGE